MNTATASYPFEVVQNGNDHVFTYKKAKLGLRTVIPMLWPSLILSAFLAYRKAANSPLHHTPTEKLSVGITFWIVYTIVIAIGVVVILNLIRRPGSFTLNNQGILLNGTLYPYKDIQGLYIKSPNGSVSQNLTMTSTGFVGFSNDRVQNIGLGTAGAVATATSGIVSGATQLSAASGRAIGNSIKRKSFKICFLFGKSEKVLARQITEITAIQLLQKIDSLA